MKVRAEGFGQEPRGDVEVFVMRLGQLPALGLRFFEGRRDVGNAIARPAARPNPWPASASVAANSSILWAAQLPHSSECLKARWLS